VSSNQNGVVLVHPEGEPALPNTLLQRRELQLMVATSASRALRLIQERRPRLLVLPFRMPDMDAPELCRALRSRADTRGISLLLLAEEAGREVDLALAAGCNDVAFLREQPFELDEKIERLTMIPVRQQFRTLVRARVQLLDQERLLWGDSVDLSEGGMQIQLAEMLSPVAPLAIHFYLHGDIDPVDAKGEVIWADFSKPAARYGIEFTELAPADRRRIASLIGRIKARGA
jgi:CheY-like chemotaxis protein